MKRLHITDTCMKVIEAHAIGRFNPTGVRQGGGWEIEISDDVFAIIEKYRFDEESQSDVIIRMLQAGIPKTQ